MISRLALHKISRTQNAKERARNNLNNDGAGFLILTKLSQEQHRCLYATIEMALSGAKRQASQI